MIRVLVVDDEEPARARLASLLAVFPDVEIAGEAADGPEAIERVAALRPDAVFLDVEMPGCSGLDVAASLAAPRPQIVFCTAFDDYAVDAFELESVDYLLKPVSRARLAATVSRLTARARALADPASASEAPDAVSVTGARSVERYPERFLARRLQRYHVVAAADVLFFAVDDGITRVHTTGGHYWMQPTLNDLEARLDPARFFRVSRAVIVAIEAVREVQPHPGGSGTLTLANGTPIEVSRRRLPDLVARLGG
jgi:two-component system, LytTR family, response regulator